MIGGIKSLEIKSSKNAFTKVFINKLIHVQACTCTLHYTSTLAFTSLSIYKLTHVVTYAFTNLCIHKFMHSSKS